MNLEAIEARHQFHYRARTGDVCTCEGPWPCDAATLIEWVKRAIERAEAAEGKLGAVDEYRQWRDDHMAARPGLVPACLGPNCPACKRAQDNLLRRLLAQAQEEAHDD